MARGCGFIALGRGGRARLWVSSGRAGETWSKGQGMMATFDAVLPVNSSRSFDSFAQSTNNFGYGTWVV